MLVNVQFFSYLLQCFDLLWNYGNHSQIAMQTIVYLCIVLYFTVLVHCIDSLVSVPCYEVHIQCLLCALRMKAKEKESPQSAFHLMICLFLRIHFTYTLSEAIATVFDFTCQMIYIFTMHLIKTE